MNVIVIGAGVIGCAVGYELAARGARVQLLDMRGVGQGATRASAGVLCPYIEGHSQALLALGVRSLALYDEFVARLAADAGTSLEYRRSGTLEVAVTPAQAERLQAAAAALAGRGIEHRYLEPRDALAVEPSLTPSVAGALLVPEHGYVGVASFTAALAAAATARGATLRRARVASLEAGSASARALTTDGALDCDAIVVAAGSWARGLGPAAGAVPVKPIRGQLLQLSCGGPPASRVVWGADCYLVPWQDGTVLVGATVEDVGFDERATVEGVRGLLDRACDLVPALRAAAFDGVRVGLRPASDDELPIVGRSSRHHALYYATGHYRNGILLAPLTALAIADLVLSGSTAHDLTAADPRRFAL